MSEFLTDALSIYFDSDFVGGVQVYDKSGRGMPLGTLSDVRGADLFGRFSHEIDVSEVDHDADFETFRTKGYAATSVARSFISLKVSTRSFDIDLDMVGRKGAVEGVIHEIEARKIPRYAKAMRVVETYSTRFQWPVLICQETEFEALFDYAGFEPHDGERGPAREDEAWWKAHERAHFHDVGSIRASEIKVGTITAKHIAPSVIRPEDLDGKLEGTKITGVWKDELADIDPDVMDKAIASAKSRINKTLESKMRDMLTGGATTATTAKASEPPKTASDLLDSMKHMMAGMKSTKSPFSDSYLGTPRPMVPYELKERPMRWFTESTPSVAPSGVFHGLPKGI